MMEQLISVAGGRLLIPLMVVVVGVALVKGGFSLARSRSQDRRDFLELFQSSQDRSDFWISVAVRHVFGAYLPTALIRMLMGRAQPGRALLEVSNSWEFLDADDETGELRWRRSLFADGRRRRIVILMLNIVYFVVGSASFFLAYLCLVGTFSGRAMAIAWIYAFLGFGAAFTALAYGDSLKAAHKAAVRWLGMP